MLGCSSSSLFAQQLSGVLLSTQNYKGSQAEAAAQRSSKWSTASLELLFPDFSADRRVMPRLAEVIGKFFRILQMVVLYRQLVNF